MTRKREVSGGSMFGLWVVLCEGEKKNGNRHFVCKCECGKTGNVSISHLVTGASRGCRACGQKKHGMTGKRFYSIRQGIKGRCKNYGYSTYCDERDSFENFKRDMYSEYEKHKYENGEVNTTIDRINGKLGYSKKNCRWATYKRQAENTSRNVRFDGLCITQRAEKLGLKRNTIIYRLRYGWTWEEIINTPLNQRRRS